MEKESYNYLRELGCCKLCCLRFLGYKSVDCYLNVKDTLEKKGFLDAATEDPPAKRPKENICVTCLNLMQSSYINNLISKVENCKNIKLYDSKAITCAVSLPISLHLRALAVWLGLIDRFPSLFKKDTQPDVPLKEVWKWLFAPKLSQALGVELGANGSLITVHLDYSNDETEIDTLMKLKPKLFQMRSEQKRKYHGEKMTRKFFELSFNPRTVKLEEFKEHCGFPSKTPDTELELTDIEILGDTLFLAGRYNKYSRNVCQTPWILDGKRLMEGSVQEIISEPVLNTFKSSPTLLRFSSSGREDVDVRCLGRGRPFVLELPDCKSTNIDFNMLRKLEVEINKSNDVKVKDLQIVKREELTHIKQGEETKTKQYRALCMCTGDITLTENILETLNMPTGFKIKQRTPIRVLHRRPLMTRDREVFTMKASLVKDRPQMFYLDVSTQAGTYIKELVHGDLGRTIPNIKGLLTDSINKNSCNNDTNVKTNFSVDILALDVTAVDLDWPPTISV